MINVMPVDGITARPDAREPADLVIRNGRIHTGDTARPTAAALAVRDGRITAMGDDADIAPFVGPETRVVDARHYIGVAIGARGVPAELIALAVP